MAEFTPRIKLWLEGPDGRLVMSDYRVRLLELVAETGSLAEAASTMKLSYRRAWGKIKELEENLGIPLVESRVGGRGGGRSALTAEGTAIVQAFRRFREHLSDDLQAVFEEEFAAVAAGRGAE
jgi:molybdate transport repressor ModE-like protein